MSLIEPGDLSNQLRSARSWLKDTGPANLESPPSLKVEVDPSPGLTAKTSETKQFPTLPKATAAHSPKEAKRPKKPVPTLGNNESVAAGQYDRMIEDMIRNESQAEITQHVIKVERSEVAALVKQVARAKGRYLATLLESSKGKSVPSSRIEDLKQLRETYDELLQGLNDLRSHIVNGTVLVVGVRN